MLRKGFFLISVVGLLFANVACEDEEHDVLMFDNKYDPKSLDIFVGDNVLWENNGSDSHTATFKSGLEDTGTVNPVDISDDIDFGNVGTFSYACDFHPKMKGTLGVKPHLLTTGPDANVGESADFIWATSKLGDPGSIPAGWSVDAEYKAPGKKKWVSVAKNETSLAAGTILFEKAGTYKARARLQNDTDKKLSSGWSPVNTLNVVEP
jgi:plastocyanin